MPTVAGMAPGGPECAGALGMGREGAEGVDVDYAPPAKRRGRPLRALSASRGAVVLKTTVSRGAHNE